VVVGQRSTRTGLRPSRCSGPLAECYVWPQDLGAQMRQAETMRLWEASAIAEGIAPNV
jgi:hypothetical protein